VLHYEVSQLSVSPENTILHYLHLDVGEVSNSQVEKFIFKISFLEIPLKQAKDIAEVNIQKEEFSFPSIILDEM
jgi:hypothetical protein